MILVIEQENSYKEIIGIAYTENDYSQILTNLYTYNPLCKIVESYFDGTKEDLVEISRIFDEYRESPGWSTSVLWFSGSKVVRVVLDSVRKSCGHITDFLRHLGISVDKRTPPKQVIGRVLFYLYDFLEVSGSEFLFFHIPSLKKLFSGTKDIKTVLEIIKNKYGQDAEDYVKNKLLEDNNQIDIPPTFDFHNPLRSLYEDGKSQSYMCNLDPEIFMLYLTVPKSEAKSMNYNFPTVLGKLKKDWLHCMRKEIQSLWKPGDNVLISEAKKEIERIYSTYGVWKSVRGGDELGKYYNIKKSHIIDGVNKRCCKILSLKDEKV